MFNSIKSKLVLMSFVSIFTISFCIMLSYFLAMHEIKSIMRKDLETVADAMEKSVSYIARNQPDAYRDKEFKKLIYDVKIGKSGYVYMMDAAGVLTVHPTNEGSKLAGNNHIDQIRKDKSPGVVEYVSVSTGQDKIAAYRYVKELDQWVVSGVNKADYYDLLKGNFLKWNIGCAVVIALLLSIARMRIIRSITVPVMSAIGVANRLATGDLTVVIPENELARKGELGELNNAQQTMVNGLNSMVVRINSSAQALNGISESISEAARQVTLSGKEQSVAVDETAAAVDAINLSVQDVANGVDVLSSSAAEASSATIEMAASVEEVAMNMDKLSTTVDEVGSSIIEMASAAREISGSAQVLMDISSTTASSISQMDFSIKQVGEHARNSAEIAREVLNDVKAGRESVHATIDGIAEIKSATKTTSEVINELASSAADINEILRVIDDVTAQTNLLALNAAIIAAQAGEHGKGFAVVADEIKQLADRTKYSTREISMVISGVLKNTSLAVKAIAAAEQSIESGGKLSRHSGEVLENIYVRVRDSADQVGEIARATVEQASGSHMISQAMENLAQMVVQIRNATREHERGNELIMAAVEQIKDMNRHVSNSTREQIKASKEIAFSTENINDMSQQIKQACDKQSSCSNRITAAMEQIFQSAGVNNQATEALNSAVTGLVSQVDNLQKEMGIFRTKKDDERLN
jgi:methyl-accepting chemotaxis protein